MDFNTNCEFFDLHIEAGVWKVYFDHHNQTPDVPGSEALSMGQQPSGSMWIGTAVGPKGLTRDEALEIVQRIFLSRAGKTKAATVSEFVQKKFVPIYLESRSVATRINYRSILKHIIDPDIVDRAFGIDASREGKRIRFVAGWPYLGDMNLEEVGPDSVQNLINTAIKCGYSMHTVSQIRNAVCMIFSFAAMENNFGGKNPARFLEWPGLRQRSLVHRINSGTTRNDITSGPGLQYIE